MELSESSGVLVKKDGLFAGRVPADWRERFARAFEVEFREWIDAVAAGAPTGPSAWDGYATTAVAEAAVQALTEGGRATVELVERPALYA